MQIGASLPGTKQCRSYNYKSAVSTARSMSRAKRMGLQGSSSAIYAVCEAERPLTIRGCFYRVMSLGHVPKTEDGYRQVQQRALKMRRNRSLPYGVDFGRHPICGRGAHVQLCGRRAAVLVELVSAGAVGQPGCSRSVVGGEGRHHLRD